LRALPPVTPTLPLAVGLALDDELERRGGQESLTNALALSDELADQCVKSPAEQRCHEGDFAPGQSGVGLNRVGHEFPWCSWRFGGLIWGKWVAEAVEEDLDDEHPADQAGDEAQFVHTGAELNRDKGHDDHQGDRVVDADDAAVAPVVGGDPAYPGLVWIASRALVDFGSGVVYAL
jgi:hypothetical protein